MSPVIDLNLFVMTLAMILNKHPTIIIGLKSSMLQAVVFLGMRVTQVVLIEVAHRLFLKKLLTKPNTSLPTTS